MRTVGIVDTPLVVATSVDAFAFDNDDAGVVFVFVLVLAMVVVRLAELDLC